MNEFQKLNDGLEGDIVKANNLAKDILVMSRNKLFVNFRFLESAISRLKIEPIFENSKLFEIYNETKNSEKNISNEIMTTDGEVIKYNFVNVFNQYKNDKNSITRSYLHTILHCINRHLFVGKLVNQTCWDLACDIAVENIINEFNIKDFEVKNQMFQKEIFNDLKINIKILTAEKIYKYYLEKDLSDEEYESLRSSFKLDSHSEWYVPKQEESQNSDGETSDNSSGNNNRKKSSRNKNSLSSNNDESNKNNENENQNSNNSGGENSTELDSQNSNNDDENNSNNSGENNTELDSQNSNNSKKNNQNNSNKNEDNESFYNEKNGDKSQEKNANTLKTLENFIKKQQNLDEIIEDWKNIAEQLAIDMETFSKNYGDVSSSLIQNLKEINREKYDYTSFLKKFAVRGEIMKINDDEFDYIFYTYGLKLYENMPLIEPLEYKDVKRIKEFVIAIDTSGSVQGKLVQKFIQKTYNVLKSTESFFSKINIHIIQCDTKIQEDKKITNQKEFDDYLKNMKLRGFGGTDFKPVFSHIETLLKQKEFTNLKGLIYFTDGMGSYPLKKPNYETAFVFVENEEYFDCKVPSWAMKVILKEDEIKEF